MRSFRHPVCLVALLAPFALGCGSGLKGNIEGKWKVVSIEGTDMAKEMLPGTCPTMEFRPDGVLAPGLELDDQNDPKAAEFLKMVKEDMPTCKYTILSRDEIELSEIPEKMQSSKGSLFPGKEKGKAKVTITGDDMTFSPEGGKTVKLTRIK
jgi:hypothetical protein